MTIKQKKIICTARLHGWWTLAQEQGHPRAPEKLAELEAQLKRLVK